MSPAVLRQIPYFADLGPPVLAALASKVRERRYEAGELILLEGAPCEALYVVLSGRVKVFKTSSEGREQVLRVLGPGRSFNDVPVFDGGPNPGSAAALEASVIGSVPKAEILALVQRHPKAATAVIRLLATRLRALTLLIEDLSLRSVVARVAKLLLDHARGRGTVVEAPGSPAVHLTQQQIAAMTGSVREVVQRALKALERDGAIELRRGRILIREPEALERWIGSVRVPAS